LNVGSTLLLDIFNKSDRTEPVSSVIMEKRGLWIMTEELYTDYLHGIQERQEDEIHLDKVSNLHRCSEEFQEYLRMLPVSSNGVILVPRERRVSLTFRIVRNSRKPPAAFKALLGKK
jgi:hypothetical protein